MKPIKKENRSPKAIFGLLRAGDLGLKIQNDMYDSHQKHFRNARVFENIHISKSNADALKIMPT